MTTEIYAAFRYGFEAMEEFAKLGGWESTEDFIKSTGAGMFDQLDLYWDVGEMYAGIPDGEVETKIVASVVHGRLYREEATGIFDPEHNVLWLSSDECERVSS